MITDTASHTHEIPAVDEALLLLSERIMTLSNRIVDVTAEARAELRAAETYFDGRHSDLAGRVKALEDRLEIIPGPEPFAPDYHISPTGSDSADGLTRATAWRSISKAPAGKVTALWDGGVIAGGSIYDRAVHLVTAPGAHAMIRGAGQFSLRLQRAHGSTIHPGAGGSITAIAATDPLEPVVNGEKPGTSRRACVQLTDCNDLDLDLRVIAGSDFGILTAGTLYRCRVTADVSDAGHGYHLKGNLGTSSYRSWFGGHAHDCNRMVRSTAKAGDDYGAVGFVFEGSTGGGLMEGWAASRCFAPSPDYGYDGGGIEGYDATDVMVMPGTITDCEGGFETGGSAGRGLHRWTVSGLRLVGDLTRNGRSPAVLVRNFEGSTLDFDADVTTARVLLEVYADSGTFGGSIANSAIRGTYVNRGVAPSSLRDVPSTTTVSMVPR